MDHSTIPGDLPIEWRKRADFLRQYGDPNTARLWELAATELERAMAVMGEQTLSLTEAARVSGYTPDHLGALVKKGKIPNAGRSGAPRIRRCDLPVKEPGGPARPPHPQAVPTIHMRNVALSMKEAKR